VKFRGNDLRGIHSPTSKIQANLDTLTKSAWSASTREAKVRLLLLGASAVPMLAAW